MSWNRSEGALCRASGGGGAEEEEERGRVGRVETFVCTSRHRIPNRHVDLYQNFITLCLMMLYVLVAGGRGVFLQSARPSPNSRAYKGREVLGDAAWVGVTE
jgi:hypothetical protein